MECRIARVGPVGLGRRRSGRGEHHIAPGGQLFHVVGEQAPAFQGAGIAYAVHRQPIGQHRSQFRLVVLGLCPVHGLVKCRRFHRHDQPLVIVGRVDAVGHGEFLDHRSCPGQLFRNLVKVPPGFRVGVLVEIPAQQPDARCGRGLHCREVVAHRFARGHRVG